MKRDLDLVREILLIVESWPDSVDGQEVEIEGYSQEGVAYNTFLLHEAGYIKAITSKTYTGNAICPTQLTWKGHEFLDEARNKTVWEKAKSVAGKAGVSSLAVFRPILAKVAASEVERAIGQLLS